ncbi:MBL fold metallo-hydrolase [Alteromonas gilva]|uniref:MBL fold metallo-hydrolase n=1 Tax=Alteromonas gilva TaxID=2987522 RepID=A0ABT5L6A6_9ALTE|nr:MBL fold metallo-hydrolase [Alteromonas gilva]MDC8832016.1 MBL fold metallo-hydrolase [Alteromonas gilva]
MRVHELKGYIENIYLVEEPTGLLLLDGCSRADVDKVCTYITRTLRRPLSDLTLIVVTHMHPDHAGGAVLLQRKTGAQIASHPMAQHWYKGLAGRTAHLIDVALTWWVAARLGKPRAHIWYHPVLVPDITLQDKQRLPGFADWQVLYTPGHTNHDLSLLHRPTQQLYIADLIVSVKKQLTAPYPVCHPNQYKRSLARIKQISPSRVYSAHVRPLDGRYIDYDALMSQAPALPKNHWHSAKNRIGRVFGRRSTQH